MLFLSGLCACTKEQELIERAEKGNVEAMMILGDAYGSPSGAGITRYPSHEKEVYWLRKAANMGHTPAMYELSRVLTTLITNEERVMWLKKGAELGNEACVIELMNSYRHGLHGLPRDTGAAIYWELKRGELYLKRDKKSPEETRASLAEWEQRYRRENHYDGPVRDLH
jgi:hypothetical protein